MPKLNSLRSPPFNILLLIQARFKNEFMTKEVYYVDTEDTKKNKELSDLRDSYGVKFVPSLLYFSNENEYLTYDMNSGDLKEFLGDK